MEIIIEAGTDALEATATMGDGYQLHYQADSLPRLLLAISNDPDVIGWEDKENPHGGRVLYECAECSHRWRAVELLDAFAPCPACGKDAGALV